MSTVVTVRPEGGPPAPRVGVGVVIVRDGRVLLGQRRSDSHGDGVWQFPGGHLAYGESVEACAVREAEEETGLVVRVTGRGPWTNDVFEREHRHYLTVFVTAEVTGGALSVREPDKCAGWRWCAWDDLPSPLFLPIVHLRDQGWAPPASSPGS